MMKNTMVFEFDYDAKVKTLKEMGVYRLMTLTDKSYVRDKSDKEESREFDKFYDREYEPIRG